MCQKLTTQERHKLDIRLKSGLLGALYSTNRTFQHESNNVFLLQEISRSRMAAMQFRTQIQIWIFYNNGPQALKILWCPADKFHLKGGLKDELNFERQISILKKLSFF